LKVKAGYFSWRAHSDIGSANIGNCLDCGPDYPFGQVFGTRNDPRNIQLSLKLLF
jgi:hypothetical protein